MKIQIPTKVYESLFKLIDSTVGDVYTENNASTLLYCFLDELKDRPDATEDFITKITILQKLLVKYANENKEEVELLLKKLCARVKYVYGNTA